MSATVTAAEDLLSWADGRRWTTIYVDPPWVFANSTGKIAPQHKRLWRYSVMSMADIQELPVGKVAEERSHLYLWCPNAILPEGLETLRRWGYIYKGNIVWHKVRRDGGSDGRGVGFYYRNVTELVLFGVRGKDMRTLAPARSQVNLLATRKREHSRKPDELRTTYIERCSPGPYLELFARGPVGRPGWDAWGYEADVERAEERVHPMYRGGPIDGFERPNEPVHRNGHAEHNGHTARNGAVQDELELAIAAFVDQLRAPGRQGIAVPPGTARDGQRRPETR